MKKVFIKTHGCQMNEYDSAKMLDLLKGEEDYELAESEQQADLLILNTCSIREKAQEKVFHQIGRWKKIKDSNPDLKIAIGGCVASQEGQKIINEMTALDKMAWNNTINSFSMLAFRNKKEFVFRINLAQMWINLAFREKNGESLFSDNPALLEAFKMFNDQYPRINFYGVNQLFEEAIQAISRNLYMPLVMINLLISLQTLLKGKEPEVVI